MSEKKMKVTIFFKKITGGDLCHFQSKRTSEIIVSVYYPKEMFTKLPIEGDSRDVEV